MYYLKIFIYYLQQTKKGGDHVQKTSYSHLLPNLILQLLFGVDPLTLTGGSTDSYTPLPTLEILGLILVSSNLPEKIEYFN